MPPGSKPGSNHLRRPSAEGRSGSRQGFLSRFHSGADAAAFLFTGFAFGFNIISSCRSASLATFSAVSVVNPAGRTTGATSKALQAIFHILYRLQWVSILDVYYTCKSLLYIHAPSLAIEKDMCSRAAPGRIRFTPSHSSPCPSFQVNSV